MRKKISLFMLCGIVLLGVCGCVLEKETDGSDGSVEIIYNCSILDNIKFISYDGIDTYAITNDNILYSFGKYSDGTNCKKVDNNLKFTKIIAYYFMDNQKKLYNISNGKLNNYEYQQKFEYAIDDDNIIKTANLYTNDIKYLKSDGKIYLANINSVFSHGTTKYYLEDEKEYVSFKNEKILDFSQELEWIKTDKAYYIRRPKDKKCYEYDDIECEYEFQKDEELTKQYDEISFVRSCPNELKCNYVLKSGKVISYLY